MAARDGVAARSPPLPSPLSQAFATKAAARSAVRVNVRAQAAATQVGLSLLLLVGCGRRGAENAESCWRI